MSTQVFDKVLYRILECQTTR